MTKYDKSKGRVKEKYQKIKKMAAIVFTVTTLLFVCFFLYMGINENVSVYSPRYSPYYGTIINLTPEIVPDESAPMGIRTVYSWLMDAHCETGDYLCFYVSNNHVNVTVDGETIFSLHSSEDRRVEESIGKSISSNWCIIPLEPEDAGRRFTVELTPLIADLLSRDVEFLIGSNYNIVLAQLRNDTPQLILSMMCIALGLIIFLIQCYLQIFSGTSQWDQIFLGVFSMILGVWRITDIRSADFCRKSQASGIYFHGNAVSGQPCADPVCQRVFPGEACQEGTYSDDHYFCCGYGHTGEPDPGAYRHGRIQDSQSCYDVRGYGDGGDGIVL